MKTRLHSFTGTLPSYIGLRILLLLFITVALITSINASATSNYNQKHLHLTVDTSIVTGGSQPSQFNLPLVLTEFSVSYNDQAIALNWTTGQEKDLSHFVIERSSNGMEYSEIALIFTGSKDNVKQQYAYKDVLKTAVSGMLYYRLKLVDMLGRIQYSDIKIKKTANKPDNRAFNLSVYPNPVADEMRISVPASWVNKAIVCNLYNSNGQLVKHIAINKCANTEVVNIKQLIAGVYVVKAYADDMEISSRLMKQ